MKSVKRKLCAILCAAVLVGVLTPTASAATFSDVYNHWAASYIETCAGRGIVDGVGGGKFDPEGTVTNAQFVKMLCMAFFADEEKAFEAEHWNDIYNNFSGVLYWYSAMGYYFKVNSLLTGTTYTIITSEHANKPMDRNNMAQVTANVLARKGIGVDDADLNTAQSKMPDYSTIPEGYRRAVKTCYALGVITGTDGGRFDGGSTMTRAQACAVITRLLDVVERGNTTEFAVKDIQVSSEYWSGHTMDGSISGNAWSIEDNGFPNGYLNNGKPITEENVLELLHEAEKIWPNDMKWSESGPDNNFYKNSGSVVSTMLGAVNLGTQWGVSSNFACGGYSAMISDYLFGRDNNMYHQVTNLNDIRPGDVIVRLDHRRADHVMLAVSRLGGAYGQIDERKKWDGFLYITDGNDNDKVYWPGPYNIPIEPGDETWTVWSRYPE